VVGLIGARVRVTRAVRQAVDVARFVAWATCRATLDVVHAIGAGIVDAWDDTAAERRGRAS
jgi:hypothetical protein